MRWCREAESELVSARRGGVGGAEQSEADADERSRKDRDVGRGARRGGEACREWARDGYGESGRREMTDSASIVSR